ncbi:MAG: hypothetical protein V3T83_09765, partial [Acidobacteriota bacterium]
CIRAGGTRLLRCSPGYACIAEHRQRGASTPLVLTLFRKRWSRIHLCYTPLIEAVQGTRQGQARLGSLKSIVGHF